MRYIFDHNLAPTRLIEMLESHLERRIRPSWGALLGVYLFPPTNSTEELLKGNVTPKNQPRRIFSPSEILRAFNIVISLRNMSETTGEYVDCHVSRWTRKSFERHFNVLYEMGLVRMKLVHISNEIGNPTEFAAIFTRV